MLLVHGEIEWGAVSAVQAFGELRGMRGKDGGMPGV